MCIYELYCILYIYIPKILGLKNAALGLRSRAAFTVFPYTGLQAGQ